MSTPEALTPGQWRSLGITIYLPTALSMVGFGAVTPLVALTARALGASVPQASFIVALLGLGGLLGALPAGVLADRFGEKRALMGALTIDAVCMLAAFVAPNLWVLGGAVLVVGLASAMLLLARQSYLTEAVPYRFRARALSTLGGVFRIGSFLGPLAGAAVVVTWGIGAAYVLAAITSLLAAAITGLLPDLPPTPHAHDPESPTQLGPILRAHARTYLTIGLGAAGLMLVRASRDALLPLWCEAQGLSAATTSLIFALSSGVDMLLFYLGGTLMDRFGRRAVAVPAMVIMGACFGLLPLTASAAAIALVAVGLGLGNGISSGVVMTLGSDASPHVGRSKFLAGWRLTTGLGQAGGPVLVTAITAVTSLTWAAVSIAMLAGVGAAWLWYWAGRNPGESRG